MPQNQDSLEEILEEIKHDIKLLKADRDGIELRIQEAETTLRYLLSRGGHDNVPVSRRPVELVKSVLAGKPSTLAEAADGPANQRQRVIEMAIEILVERDNKPIKRDELWSTMQAKGLIINRSNPEHYVASKVVGNTKDIFGNDNGYYLLKYPR
ncbi:hypothetical protein [Rhizobium leguminosarum]|uniref:Uncharacterized protein n=1 Tax=Rhizobium leguminosarum TaxID=384 RepID=A0A7K3VJS9_RHILE|nr:hypothetical protein [Rhizobium leguminosarum]NEK17453.1 hypothetical protein [Rhizobium leguminosarum]